MKFNSQVNIKDKVDFLGDDGANFDVFLVEDGLLYFGDKQSGDGFHDTTRPKRLNYSFYLRRK